MTAGQIQASEQRVLSMLKEGAASMVFMTTYLRISPHTVRNAISQLRDFGYEIEYKRGIYKLLD